MVERPSDSVLMSGGLIAILFKWLFFRAWTLFGVLSAAFGFMLFFLTLVGSVTPPAEYAGTVTRFDLNLMLVYSVSLMVLGGLVTWLNALVGNQTIQRNHRYAYQVIATFALFLLLVWGWELTDLVIPTFVFG